MGGLDTLVWNNPEKTFDMDKYGFGYKNGWTSPDNGKTVNIGYNSYTLQDASWTTEVLRGTVTDVDNLQIRDKVAFSGDNATVADGVLSSKLFVETAEEAPSTAIVAVYDKADGRLADVSFDAMNQSVFASVCGLFADDILLDASGEPVVTLTFNYQNGKNDVITFSDYNERYYSVAKNGETKYMILKAKISDLAKVLDECK